MSEWWSDLVLADGRVVYLLNEQAAMQLLTTPEKFLNDTQREVVALLTKRREQESKGFGDTLKSMFSAVGISPCSGCQERAEKLNELFPYRRRIE